MNAEDLRRMVAYDEWANARVLEAVTRLGEEEQDRDMLGASIIKMKDIGEVATRADIPVFALGFVVAFISALVVIRALIGYVSRNTFRPFAFYRIALGVALVALYWNHRGGF